MHVGNEKMYPFPAKIKQALKDSTYFVMELDAIGVSEGEYQQTSDESIYLKKGNTIDDYLSKDTREFLKKRAKEYELSYNSIKHYRLSNILYEFLYAETAGLTFEYGVDYKLKELANTYRLSLKYLETPEFQFETLNKLYSETDANRIIKKIPARKAAKQEIIEEYENYIEGKIPHEDVQSFDEFDAKEHKYLLEDRNKMWVKKLESYIKSGNTHFVTVGAAHLGGKDGLLTYFREKDYKVQILIN